MSTCITSKPDLYIRESQKKKTLLNSGNGIENSSNTATLKMGFIYLLKLKTSNQNHIITTDDSLSQFLDKYPILKHVTNTHK